jgi:hypothetical protein
MTPTAHNYCNLQRQSPGVWVCANVNCGRVLQIPDERHIPLARCKGYLPRAPGSKKPLRPNHPVGVGTAITDLIQSLGMKPRPGCFCKSMARKMNNWGPAGCREHRDEIIAHLNRAYSEQSTWATIRAAYHAAASGAVFDWLNPLDPAGSLLDRALAVAEGRA